MDEIDDVSDRPLVLMVGALYGAEQIAFQDASDEIAGRDALDQIRPKAVQCVGGDVHFVFVEDFIQAIHGGGP